MKMERRNESRRENSSFYCQNKTSETTYSMQTQVYIIRSLHHVRDSYTQQISAQIPRVSPLDNCLSRRKNTLQIKHTKLSKKVSILLVNFCFCFNYIAKSTSITKTNKLYDVGRSIITSKISRKLAQRCNKTETKVK